MARKKRCASKPSHPVFRGLKDQLMVCGDNLQCAGHAEEFSGGDLSKIGNVIPEKMQLDGGVEVEQHGSSLVLYCIKELRRCQALEKEGK